MAIFSHVKTYMKISLLTLFLLFLPTYGTFFLSYFMDKSQQDLTVPIAIVDHDQSLYSTRIIEHLKEEGNFTIFLVEEHVAQKKLETNEVDTVIVFLENFQEKLLEEQRQQTVELWKAPNSIAYGIVKEKVASVVTRYTSNILAANRVQALAKQYGVMTKNTWEDAFFYAEQQWEPKPLMEIDYTTSEIINSEHDEKGVHHKSQPMIWTFFVFITCLLTSDWLIRERKLFMRISLTYEGLYKYVLKKQGTLFLFHFLQLSVSYFLIASLDLGGSHYVTYIGMVVFTFYSQSLSYFLAVTIKRLENYYLLGIVIVFILSIFGGSFFTISELSPTLANVSFLFGPSSFEQLLFTSSLNGSSLLHIGNIFMWGFIFLILASRKLGDSFD